MLNSLSEHQYLVSKIFSDVKVKHEITIRAATVYHKWAKKNDIPLISKATPAENRMGLRTAIRKCKNFIYLIDFYFGKEGLEFLIDNFDYQNVKEIKLLSSIHNNWNQINEDFKYTFYQYRKELQKKGISVEMRLVSTKEAFEKKLVKLFDIFIILHY